MKEVTLVLVFIILFAIAVYVLDPYSYLNSQNYLLDEIRVIFYNIDPKYAAIPLREGDSSHTENKEVITLCLKNPNTGKYYDMNVLTYVALHELAHVITRDGDPNDSHCAKFQENFNKLLKIAEEKGSYDPSKPIPEDYCKKHE